MKTLASVSVLVFLVCGSTLAQSPATEAPADPYAAAAARVKLDIYRPTTAPEGFVLGDVELDASQDPMLLVRYFHPDGRQLYVMETSPEGMDCPECATVQVRGADAPYQVFSINEETRVVDLTVKIGGTAVVLGLAIPAAENQNTALSLLKSVAESLEKVTPAAMPPAGGDGEKDSGLRAAAAQASFPAYLPGWLPEYFYLKAVTFTPETPASDEDPGASEELTVVYAGPVSKEISVVMQPPKALELPNGPGHTAVTIRGWPAVMIKEKDQVSLVMDAKDCMILLVGSVQDTTLIRVARSLQVLK